MMRLKISNIKFHENFLIDSGIVSYVQTKLRIDFQSRFSRTKNVPENMPCVTVDKYTIELFRHLLSFVGLMHICQLLQS
jgi:hypothetical protein